MLNNWTWDDVDGWDDEPEDEPPQEDDLK